jgi:hypothetical protein
MSGVVSSASTSYHVRRKLKAIFLGFLPLLFATAGLRGQTSVPNNSAQSEKHACSVAEPNIDGSTDLYGLKEYKEAVADLLKQQKFDDLDCIAHAVRSERTRFPGGLWKLHNIYIGLTEPTGHATEEDWTERISLLQTWVTAKPNSITARVALAEAYSGYAWDARGNGYSNTVTDSGWKLFNQREEQAKTILDQAADLPEKCPEWYLAVQQMAEGPEERAAFERAVAFEPDYYYYYRIHATELLPKWNGEEGDTPAFVAQAADHLGGAKGDILYFQVASNLACACNDPEFYKLSWERIQKGFAAVEKAYGASIINSNSLALMAVQFNDYVAADAAFKQIGDQWDESVWKTEQYFEANKHDAAKMGPLQARSRAMIQEAIANQKTPEGARYQKEVEQKLMPFVQKCASAQAPDLQKFDYMLLVDKNGTPQNGWSPQPTNMMGCLAKEFMTATIKKETPFPRPPRDSYWLKLEIDLSVYKATSSQATAQ